MTPEKLRRMISVAKALRKQAERADEFDLKLANGAEIGSHLGTIADELESAVEHSITLEKTLGRILSEGK